MMSQSQFESSDVYKIKRDQLKEERKKLLTGKYVSGHEGEKLVTKSYAYEVDPTVEITHKLSSEKKSMMKKQMSATMESGAWAEGGYRQRSGYGYSLEGKYKSGGGAMIEEGKYRSSSGHSMEEGGKYKYKSGGYG
jgi:hypothetical protein